MSNFRAIDRKTGYLLSPSVDEWLPEKHLARFIVDVIEGLDLGRMSRAYRGTGSASYHPRTLLNILVYGYATGVFSSRKLERATWDSVGVSLHCGRRTSRPRHDRDVSAALPERHRETVRGCPSARARDGRAEDGHDRARRDEDTRQREPAQRAFL